MYPELYAAVGVHSMSGSELTSPRCRFGRSHSGKGQGQTINFLIDPRTKPRPTGSSACLLARKAE